MFPLLESFRAKYKLLYLLPKSMSGKNSDDTDNSLNNSTIMSQEDVTGLMFAFGYNPYYRYYYSEILLDEFNRIDTLFPELTQGQKENLLSMLKIEYLVNAVQYCSDLAGMFILSLKEPSEYLKTISSLHETGSGSIKEFYELIPIRDENYFWKLFGYDRIELTELEKPIANNSISKFNINIRRISDFYLEFYQFYSSYKHGLRIISIDEETTGRNHIYYATKYNDFDMLSVKSNWYKPIMNIVKLAYKMFIEIIEPLISWIQLSLKTNFDFENKEIEVTTIAEEVEDPRRTIEMKGLKGKFPWKIYVPGRRIPFFS